MNLPPLTVIEASAGTGKTFSLVTRLLRLIFDGTAPERIVALTFSRMAAGEIFNSFIERLSKAAGDEAVAREESERMGRVLSAADFAGKLREVISRQHLSLIGTLDSFMMRVVRMMPLELGLEGELAIMSEYRSPVERMRLVGEMMMRQSDDAKDIFRQAFRLVFGEAGAKGFLGAFSDFIEKWHQKYRDLAENGSLLSAWGDPAVIWGGNVPEHLEIPLSDIRSLADGFGGYAGRKGADAFIEAVRTFGGAVPKIPKCMRDDPSVRSAVGKMHAWRIGRSLKETRGIFLLMHAYEAAYASKVRSRGLVTFDDLPRLLNSLPDGVRLPLEYRMDAKFDHWALDEFQDTSRGQWKALENLIGEAGSAGSGKSVFIVGDRKQSIYEWRGGDVEILGQEVDRAAEKGNLLVSLDESRRYVSVISDCVNRVFGENTLCGAIDMDDAPESAKWKFREHKSHDRDTVGFVEVIQAEKAGKQAAVSDFFEPIRNAVEAVKPWDRGISTAVLVRKKSTGEAIFAYLKSAGISKVVFEGDSAVSDSPVLSAMTALVKLAEHPNDGFAYAQIRYSPIAEALYPGGLPAAAELSARLLEEFTRFGMVRRFREIREALKKIPCSWNGFTESRFEDFIKCAAEFEQMRDATMRLSDFIEFLSRKTRRDYAESGMVRIMTMHQSKGLGFDWVILPFYEPEKLVSERHVGPLGHSRPDWITVNPGYASAMTDPVLAKAERARRQIQTYNSLCLDYVAMTRAKLAMTIILNPQNAAPDASPGKFSDLVRLSGLETRGNPAWYLAVRRGKEERMRRKRPAVARPPRPALGKSRPGESFYSGLGGDALFGENFGRAAELGTEAHRRYELIEWAQGDELASLPAGFRVAFERKSEGDTLWRERSYELVMDGKWESGRFDRVVFTGDGADRSAVIYDFKTNGMSAGESGAGFSRRMREMYSSQMGSYRRALSLLTGIAPEKIGCVLLLEATGEALVL